MIYLVSALSGNESKSLLQEGWQDYDDLIRQPLQESAFTLTLSCIIGRLGPNKVENNSQDSKCERIFRFEMLLFRYYYFLFV